MSRPSTPIVARGVLVDVAKAKGVERLDPGYAITIADVEATLAREKVAIGAGDVVLVHTGWGGLWGKDNTRFLSGEPSPGLDLIPLALRAADRRARHRLVEHRPGAGRRSGAAVSGAADHVRENGPVRFREPGNGRVGQAWHLRVSVRQHPSPHAGDRPRPSSLRRRCFDVGRCGNRHLDVSGGRSHPEPRREKRDGRGCPVLRQIERRRGARYRRPMRRHSLRHSDAHSAGGVPT
jgi:hypothetical protein